MMIMKSPVALAISLLACAGTGFGLDDMLGGGPLKLSDFQHPSDQPAAQPAPEPAAQPAAPASAQSSAAAGPQFKENSLPSVAPVSIAQVLPSSIIPSIPAISIPAPITLSQAPSSADSQPTAPPAVGGGMFQPGVNQYAAVERGHMTVAIYNFWDKEISASFANNAGGPTPVGNPAPAKLPSSTTVVFPTGWAGRVLIGSGPEMDPQGSLIEGSYTGAPDIDVSYVDGYSVPITCYAAGKAVTGCNIDLFKQGIECEADMLHGDVCYNSARPLNDGPPPPFFDACKGLAYTFPNDNNANDGDFGPNVVECCIGGEDKCPHNPGRAKRDVESAAEAAFSPRAPTLMARHKRHIHRHLHGGLSHKHFA